MRLKLGQHLRKSRITCSSTLRIGGKAGHHKFRNVFEKPNGKTKLQQHSVTEHEVVHNISSYVSDIEKYISNKFRFRNDCKEPARFFEGEVHKKTNEWSVTFCSIRNRLEGNYQQRQRLVTRSNNAAKLRVRVVAQRKRRRKTECTSLHFGENNAVKQCDWKVAT